MVYKTGDELMGRESNNSMSDGCYNEEEDGIDKLGLIDEGRDASLESAVFGLKGVLHLWALFLKTLCIFSQSKATLDKVSYGSGHKCSKELKNHSFTSVQTIVVKLL